MSVENKLYYNFKSYGHYLNKSQKRISKPKKNIKPLLGAGLGVLSGMALTCAVSKKLPKGVEDKTFYQAGKMITMAGFANIGSVLMGSINAKPDSVKRKWKEAGFQMMNMALPMIMVSSVLEIFKKVKSISDNKPLKIIGSFTAMISGAMLATKITNIGRKPEEKRKYTIKDSVANFDDIVATIAIGFKDINNIIHADSLLPFIYTYCAQRAGNKE